MKTALYTITSYAPHYYHVHIMDGSEYTGKSWFCKDYKEAIDYALYNECEAIKKL